MAIRRRGWDSNACIAFLRGEPGRVEACGRLLEAAEKGYVEIAISALTIAEVLWPRGEVRVVRRHPAEVVRSDLLPAAIFRKAIVGADKVEVRPHAAGEGLVDPHVGFGRTLRHIAPSGAAG